MINFYTNLNFQKLDIQSLNLMLYLQYHKLITKIYVLLFHIQY